MSGGKRTLVGKQYVDDKFAELEKRLDERAEALAKALELQRIETDRRLEELNNAHARAEKVQTLTVSQETFDLQMRDINRRFAALTVLLLTIAGWLVLK